MGRGYNSPPVHAGSGGGEVTAVRGGGDQREGGPGLVLVKSSPGTKRCVSLPPSDIFCQGDCGQLFPPNFLPEKVREKMHFFF